MDKKTLHSRKKLPNFKATFPSNSNRTPSIVKKVNREGNCIYATTIITTTIAASSTTTTATNTKINNNDSNTTTNAKGLS